MNKIQPQPEFSLAKDKIRVLLLEGVNDSAVQTLSDAGYSSVTRLTEALDGEALKEAIKGVHMLGIRSRTQVTSDIVEAADRLIAIGCFSVGTNQVDIDACRRGGIPVFNAPFSNTRSVAELVIGEIVILLRRIVARSVAAHDGQWDKSASDSHEVRGKTLGIVGYGNIGSQLSYLAEAMGMRVVFYDHTDKLRHGNTEPTATLHELLAHSDVVSMHVPETRGDPGHDRACRNRRDEAGRLFHQQQPRHGGRPRGAGRRRFARAGCAAPPSTCFRSSRARTRNASSRRCRDWTT